MAEIELGKEGAAADLMEVELLSGVKEKLPREQAQKEIEARQKIKEGRRTQDEEFGKLKAERDSQVAAAEEKRTKAEADAAVKAGEFERAKEILTKQNSERVDKLAGKYRERALESAIAATEGIVAGAAKDLAQSLASSCRFNLDADTLEVVGADGKPRMGDDGKPMSVDALIAEYVQKRPYLRAASGSQGSGANGKGGAEGKAGEMPRSTWEALSSKYRAEHFANGGTLRE